MIFSTEIYYQNEFSRVILRGSTYFKRVSFYLQFSYLKMFEPYFNSRKRGNEVTKCSSCLELSRRASYWAYRWPLSCLVWLKFVEFANFPKKKKQINKAIKIMLPHVLSSLPHSPVMEDLFDNHA